MEFELKRKVKKEVEETVVMEFQKYWVVRIIKDCGDKSCVYEEDFNCKPNDVAIANVLLKAKDKYKANVKLFATVEENYRFVEKE